MGNMNDLVVAFADKKNKAIFNNLLLKIFNELGGVEKGAVDVMVEEFTKADLVIKRASIIGKLSIMGVKSIVKPKEKKPTKKNEGPTKKELINTLLGSLGLKIDDISTLPNLKKADIQTLIDCYGGGNE